MSDWVTSLVTGILAAGVPLTLIIIIILKNPEKAEKWVSIGARLFSYFSARAERQSVSGDIQSDINAFAKSINDEIDPSVLPYGIQIKWEKTEDTSQDSFVKEGKLIVRMKHHSNQARNVAVATSLYVHGGLLPETRPYLNEDVSDGLDLAMTRKILLDRKRLDAFQLFAKETKAADEPIRLCRILDDLDGLGLFEPLVLGEFADLGKSLSGAVPTEDVKNETKDFVDFTDKLTKKAHGVDISPDFHKRFLRLSVLMIAKLTTYAEHGLDPYIHSVNIFLKGGVDSIYICARGVNIVVAEHLDNLLKQNRSWRRMGDYRRKVLDPYGRKVDGLCIVYKRIRS